MSIHANIVVQIGVEMWTEPDCELCARWLPGQLVTIYRTRDTPGLIHTSELIHTSGLIHICKLIHTSD